MASPKLQPVMPMLDSRIPSSDPRAARRRRTPLALAALAALLGACAHPPERAGNITRELGQQWRSTVEIAVEPADALCTVKGKQVKVVPGEAPRLVRLAVRDESPATVTCSKTGFVTATRTISSEQVHGSGFMPAMLLLGGVTQLAASALHGDGLRFPPMVVMALRPEGEADVEAWRKAQWQRVTERWDAYLAEQTKVCADASAWRDCRSTEELLPFRNADLSAL